MLAIDDAAELLRNDGGNRGNRLELRLVGQSSNGAAVGATVKVVSDGLVQYGRVRSGGNYLSQNDLRLQFGLSDHIRVDLIEINWPSGTHQKLHNTKPKPGSNNPRVPGCWTIKETLVIRDSIRSSKGTCNYWSRQQPSTPELIDSHFHVWLYSFTWWSGSLHAHSVS